MEKRRLAFVGCGLIGVGLAANSLLTGHPTSLYDTCDPQIIRKRISDIFDLFVEHGAYTREQTDAAAALALYTDDLSEAVRGACFVQESAPERLELKRSIYRMIQEVCGPETVIGSSASQILPSDLQEGALYPDRILSGHPFNPSHLLPAVELVAGKQTSPEALAFAKEIYTEMDKVPCVCLKEQPGYLVQGINGKILLMAIDLVAQGIATAEDVDKALMYGPGMRIPLCGQLLTIGLGCQGGWREMAQKYCATEPPKEYLLVADQVDVELANRPEALGNTLESVLRWRDESLIDLQRIQKRM